VSSTQLFEDELGLDTEALASGLHSSQRRKKISLILAAVGAACVVIGCIVGIAVVLTTNGMRQEKGRDAAMPPLTSFGPCDARHVVPKVFSGACDEGLPIDWW
jgi:hypothetical protein